MNPQEEKMMMYCLDHPDFVRDHIMTIAYHPIVYKFIEATCECYDGKFYKVNGVWQRIVIGSQPTISQDKEEASSPF